MAAIVDDYIDSPADNDDVFPCKGCGDVSYLQTRRFTAFSGPGPPQETNHAVLGLV